MPTIAPSTVQIVTLVYAGDPGDNGSGNANSSGSDTVQIKDQIEVAID